MARCETCLVCRRGCPTGAIGPDRVLLHAERCLTYHNEQPGDVPFPAWIDPSWHTCLIGCLACQRACPANPPLEVVPTGVVFTQEETSALLGEDDHRGPVWTTIRAKLEHLGQPYREDVLGRNVRALLDR